jgi:thiol:disulfide interchange protein DsbD
MNKRWVVGFALWGVAAVGAVAGPGVVQGTGVVQAGKAQVELISAAGPVKAGSAVLLGIRLKVDPGWHTYWINPGESGMKPSLEWNLPPGFGPARVLFPSPKEFRNAAGMVSYGYDGEVILPVWISWPEKLAEVPAEVTFGLKIDWLTCSEEACLPGGAQVAVVLPVGDPQPGPAAEALAAALEAVPAPRDGWELVVAEEGQKLRVTLRAPKDVDLAKATVFPVTETALDFRTPLEFAADQGAPGAWSATTTRNEFAEHPLDALELVIQPTAGPPVSVAWKK